MKKLKRILLTLFLVVMFLGNFQYAYSLTDVSNTGIKVARQTIAPDVGGTSGNLGLGDLEEYRKSGTTSVKLQDKVSTAFKWISGLGTILSVIILIGIGIKYLLASASEKANYKTSMIPYIWGVAILFSGTFLPNLIYGIIQQIGW